MFIVLYLLTADHMNLLIGRNAQGIVLIKFENNIQPDQVAVANLRACYRNFCTYTITGFLHWG